jgi:hypothetical protein
LELEFAVESYSERRRDRGGNDGDYHEEKELQITIRLVSHICARSRLLESF